MLFPLFLLSLLQLLVLPGLLLHRLLGLRSRGLEWAVGIAVLSLIGNYVLMHGLMMAPLLRTAHLPWIVAAEAVALGIAYRDGLRDTVRVPLIGLGLMLVGLALLAWLVSPDVPSVFTTNDAVLSWNRWALSWAADEAPERTVMYPQLVPSLYAVVYLLTGDATLQVLSKPVAIAFPVLILLISAAQAERGRLITAGVAIIGALGLLVLLRKTFVNGDADMPAGTLVLVAIAFALTARDTKDPSDLALQRQRVWLGAVAAATAAVTKQAGLLVAIVYPLLILVLFPSRCGRRLAVQSAGLIAVLALPWYAYSLLMIFVEEERSNLGYLLYDLHAGRSIPERLAHAASLISGYSRHWLLAVFGLLCSVGVFVSRARWPILLVVLPYTLLWGCFWSYAGRNLYPALPVAAFLAGWMLEDLARRVLPAVEARLDRLRGWAPAWDMPLYACFALAVLAIGLGRLVSDSEIRAANDAGRARIGDVHINRALLEHFRPKGFQGTLITNYGLAPYVPALKDLRVARDPFTLAPSVRRIVSEHPEACILQLQSNAVRSEPQAARLLDRMITEGSYHVAAEGKDWRLLAPGSFR
jgi:hypothetical protein